MGTTRSLRTVSKRLLGLLLGTTKKIDRYLTGSSPVTFPETSAGRSSAPVPFPLLKWPIEGQTSPWCNQLRRKNENAPTELNLIDCRDWAMIFVIFYCCKLWKQLYCHWWVAIVKHWIKNWKVFASKDVLFLSVILVRFMSSSPDLLICLSVLQGSCHKSRKRLLVYKLNQG